MNNSCPFCNIDPTSAIKSYNDALAIFDAFPVSEGHILIIPSRHICSYFDATSQEKIDLLQLLSEMKEFLLNEYNPDGFNIGINDGIAAGQSVMHMHIHLIPRYIGDTPHPRGGVRWVIPSKADY